MKEVEINVGLKENESSMWGKYIEGQRQILLNFIFPLHHMSVGHIKYPQR